MNMKNKKEEVKGYFSNGRFYCYCVIIPCIEEDEKT